MVMGFFRGARFAHRCFELWDIQCCDGFLIHNPEATE